MKFIQFVKLGEFIRVFHDKIKLYILSPNLPQTMMQAKSWQQVYQMAPLILIANTVSDIQHLENNHKNSQNCRDYFLPLNASDFDKYPYNELITYLCHKLLQKWKKTFQNVKTTVFFTDYHKIN